MIEEEQVLGIPKRRRSCNRAQSRPFSEDAVSYPNSFSQKVGQFREFPPLASLAFDLVKLTVGCGKLDSAVIADKFFALVCKFERSLSGEVAKLEQKPHKSRLFVKYLECLIREIAVFGSLHGLWNENYRNKFQAILVMVLKHFVNAWLIEKFESTTNHLQSKDATRVYNFIKSIFIGAKDMVIFSEGILDTFLMSQICAAGHKNQALYGYLLQALIRDLQYPYYLINSATCLVKLLALMRVYCSENEQRLDELEDTSMTRTLRRSMKVLRGVRLTQFEDIERAQVLFKGFGKNDIHSLFRKINVTRIVGILDNQLNVRFQEERSISPQWTPETKRPKRTLLEEDFGIESSPPCMSNDSFFLPRDDTEVSDLDSVDVPPEPTEPTVVGKPPVEVVDDDIEVVHVSPVPLQTAAQRDETDLAETDLEEAAELEEIVVVDVPPEPTEPTVVGKPPVEVVDDDISICEVVHVSPGPLQTAAQRDETDLAEADPEEAAELEEVVAKEKSRRWGEGELSDSASSDDEESDEEDDGEETDEGNNNEDDDDESQFGLSLLT